MAHLYPIGTVVSFNVGFAPATSKIETFTVEAQMPPVGTSLQYRIKSDTESFRRVASEHQLSHTAAVKAGPAPLPSTQHSGEED